MNIKEFCFRNVRVFLHNDVEFIPVFIRVGGVLIVEPAINARVLLESSSTQRDTDACSFELLTGFHGIRTVRK